MDRKTLGFSGVICLALGVFTPVMSLPFVGSINYLNNGKGDGVYILLLAIASLVLILTNKLKFLWVTALPSIILMLITIIGFQIKMESMKTEMQARLSGNPFAGLANLAVQNVQLQWGWVVLFTGAILLIVASAEKEKTKEVSIEEHNSDAA